MYKLHQKVNTAKKHLRKCEKENCVYCENMQRFLEKHPNPRKKVKSRKAYDQRNVLRRRLERTLDRTGVHIFQSVLPKEVRLIEKPIVVVRRRYRQVNMNKMSLKRLEEKKIEKMAKELMRRQRKLREL